MSQQTTLDVRLSPAEFDITSDLIALFQTARPDLSVDDVIDMIFRVGIATVVRDTDQLSKEPAQ